MKIYTVMFLQVRNTISRDARKEKRAFKSLTKNSDTLCLNQQKAFGDDPSLQNVLTMQDDGTVKAVNTWSYPWIIDPKLVACDETKLADGTQLKLQDAFQGRLFNNSHIYSCVGDGQPRTHGTLQEFTVPKGHIISGLTQYSATYADTMQCSINGGKKKARRI